MDRLKEEIINMNSNMRFLSKFVREVQRGKSFLDRNNQEVKDTFLNKKFVWKLNNSRKKITLYTITDDRDDLLDGYYLGLHFLSYYMERIEKIRDIVENELNKNPDNELILDTYNKLKRLVDDTNDAK